jgi:hypothetical protein
MGVGPGTKLVISIAATLAGLALLLSLFMSSQPANPAEAFLAVLLFVGGAIALWTRAKSGPSRKLARGTLLQRTEAIERPKANEADEFLAQFIKKTDAEEPPTKTETGDLPKKSEGDEFLAQFLKK